MTDNHKESDRQVAAIAQMLAPIAAAELGLEPIELASALEIRIQAER